MVGQLQLARVTWKASCFGGSDIEEHLFSIRRDHVNRTITHLYRGPFAMRLAFTKKLPLGRKVGCSPCDDSLQALHRLLVRSSTDVARTVIVIVRKYAADFGVLLDACGPIMLMPVQVAILLHLGERPLLVAQIV